jgi:hypothetical protein
LASLLRNLLLPVLDHSSDLIHEVDLTINLASKVLSVLANCCSFILGLDASLLDKLVNAFIEVLPLSVRGR